ncbi:response regulator [Acidimicrobiaceae bacterium USS-CC1]|uniref:Response regulator n=1 Tax=Acidiferrimicrobium australe TaxID=2664430 RepID=A0ABW9R0G2_9ACTN|nr:response regulator [Acidiferrimicrobium australe]
MLVVDDERTERYLLRQYLTREGFEVAEADNGSDGLARLREGGVDLALLDVMMPGLDGMEVTRLIRQESDIPIILLTARGEEAARVAGLEVGADDYVVKPVSMPEVVARVRAQLRRANGQLVAGRSEGVLKVGDITLDVDARRCLVGDEPVELTRREFDLLAALASRPGKVLTRQQLLEAAWGTTYLSEKTVDVHLTKLRAKLGEAFRVTALRGVGYRLEG